VKLTAQRKKLLQNELCDTNDDAAPVLKKVHKPGKVTADSIHGLFEAVVNGKACVVEYEPDTALRDSEQVPLLEEGGIDAFFRREVLPYTPDAWIDPGKTLVVTRYLLLVISADPHPCAPWMRSRPTSSPWSRKPTDCWTRLSGRLSDEAGPLSRIQRF